LGGRKKSRAFGGALEDGGDAGPSLTNGAPRLIDHTSTTHQQDYTFETKVLVSPFCKPPTTKAPLHLPQQAVHEREGLASIIPDP
jgi:hypothetical protein